MAVEMQAERNNRRETRMGDARFQLGAAGVGEGEVLPPRPALTGSPLDGDEVVPLEPGRQRTERSALDVPKPAWASSAAIAYP